MHQLELVYSHTGQRFFMPMAMTEDSNNKPAPPYRAISASDEHKWPTPPTSRTPPKTPPNKHLTPSVQSNTPVSVEHVSLLGLHFQII